MTKPLQLFFLCSLFIFSLVQSTKLKAQCTGYSFTFEDITVTSITNSGIFYNYTIKNTGATSVSTNNLIINTSLSEDQSVGGDLPSGGSFIGGSVTINPNETYTGSYQTSITNYPAYPYLRLNLEYGILSNCQVSIVNGFECLRPDAEIVSLNISNTQANSIAYNLTLKNVGADTLFLSNLLLENFLSVNNTYEGTDATAGSTTVTIPAKTYLKANESGTVTYTTSGSISGYNYLIAKLSYSEQAECLTENNEEIVAIPAVNGLFSSVASETSAIMWNTETKSFTFQNMDNTNGLLEYHLYNTAGIEQVSGRISNGESTFLNVQEGYYVLLITDGKKRYSKKIIY